MSGRRKHNWPGLIQEWVLMKRKEPLLTQNEFFRRKAITPPSGNRKIGKRMALAWDESQKKAIQRVSEKAGIDLAEEMERQFKAAKTAFAVGARYILPRIEEDGVEIPATHQPSTFAEALMLMKTGGDSMREITKILTGGEPIFRPNGTRNNVQVIVTLPSNGRESAELREEARERLKSGEVDDLSNNETI
jgi:hypothetical protein